MIEITDTRRAAAASKQQKAFSPEQARAMGQGIINLALIIWTIRDIRHRSDEEIKGNRKLWMLAAFAPPLCPIAYFLFGRKRGMSTTAHSLETIEWPRSIKAWSMTSRQPPATIEWE